jgi:hypothetical protein
LLYTTIELLLSIAHEYLDKSNLIVFFFCWRLKVEYPKSATFYESSLSLWGNDTY